MARCGPSEKTARPSGQSISQRPPIDISLQKAKWYRQKDLALIYGACTPVQAISPEQLPFFR